jgi:hypothetical protein
MSERANLLHNMSAPPKSVAKYTGLSGLSPQNGPGGSGVGSGGYEAVPLFGTPIRFDLDPELSGLSSRKLLSRLAPDFAEHARADPAQRLAELVNQRASALPLPDGCVVISAHPSHRVLWKDPLTVLAILSKSTDCVWLRSKTPSLQAALRRNSVSLLVPPAFAARLPGVGQ